MVSYSWMIECLKMYEIFDQVLKFKTKAMKNWYMELTADGKTSARGENPGRHLPVRLALATNVCYNNDTTQLYTKELQSEATNLQNQKKK